ncbi:hypothetical protein PR048_004884 [Dryococelus australis]|uniref:Uncharacterized protein n=1 Tax=Dryococelus australis TaxID=614101 RepID=A0ABQ9I6P4_9NEOP|nr:hypothetical protein PR048_004884 [Dryococelus australis]
MHLNSRREAACGQMRPAAFRPPSRPVCGIIKETRRSVFDVEVMENSAGIHSCVPHSTEVALRGNEVRHVSDDYSFSHKCTVEYSTLKVRRRTRTDEAAEVAVIAAAAVNPHASTPQRETETGIPKTRAHRILMRHTSQPYHVHLNQESLGNDFQNRVEFCLCAQHQIIANPSFVSDVLFADESSFSASGQLNTRNMYYWADENSLWIQQVDHQREFNSVSMAGNDRSFSRFRQSAPHGNVSAHLIQDNPASEYGNNKLKIILTKRPAQLSRGSCETNRKNSEGVLAGRALESVDKGENKSEESLFRGAASFPLPLSSLAHPPPPPGETHPVDTTSSCLPEDVIAISLAWATEGHDGTSPRGSYAATNALDSTEMQGLGKRQIPEKTRWSAQFPDSGNGPAKSLEFRQTTPRACSRMYLHAQQVALHEGELIHGSAVRGTLRHRTHRRHRSERKFAASNALRPNGKEERGGAWGNRLCPIWKWGELWLPTPPPQLPAEDADGNTVSLGRRSDKALGVRVIVARIAPSFLTMDAQVHTPLSRIGRCEQAPLGASEHVSAFPYNTVPKYNIPIEIAGWDVQNILIATAGRYVRASTCRSPGIDSAPGGEVQVMVAVSPSHSSVDPGGGGPNKEEGAGGTTVPHGEREQLWLPTPFLPLPGGERFLCPTIKVRVYQKSCFWRELLCGQTKRSGVSRPPLHLSPILPICNPPLLPMPPHPFWKEIAVLGTPAVLMKRRWVRPLEWNNAQLRISWMSSDVIAASVIVQHRGPDLSGHMYGVLHLQSRLGTGISMVPRIHSTDHGDYSGKITCLPSRRTGRFPAGFLPDFGTWESYRTMPLVGMLSRGFPVSPALHFGAAPYSPLFIFNRLSRSRC